MVLSSAMYKFQTATTLSKGGDIWNLKRACLSFSCSGVCLMWGNLDIKGHG